MGNKRYQMNQLISNDRFHKKSSNESNDQLKGTNHLSIKERDYMIRTAMRRLGIEAQWKPAVARAANYISGDRFWNLVEYSDKARSKAKCFIKCINNEMFR